MMKIEIKFSDQLTDDECDMLLNNDDVKAYLSRMPYYCRLYEATVEKDGWGVAMCDPNKPSILIKSFIKENDKWYGFVEVPEPYQKYIPLIKTGYIHPIVMMCDNKPHSILCFEMLWINGTFVVEGDNNKHVYILAIDACIDLPTYTFLIKATNKDEAFEIFWNRYKDFPEADIDTEFGASDLCDDGSSIYRLHREKFVRINENTMESTEEIFSTTSIRLCDAPKCVHIDDDITYIPEV